MYVMEMERSCRIAYVNVVKLYGFDSIGVRRIYGGTFHERAYRRLMKV